MKKQHIVYLFSFLVAAGAISYELVYCQLLTVMFGQTVLRYSVTIGLYLFFSGLGSVASKKLSSNRVGENFWLAQFVLSIIGPLGVLFVVYFDSFYFFNISHSAAANLVLLSAAHIPIVMIGFLVGLQIPVLVKLCEGEKNTGMFVDVLAFDYFGSLVGATVYGLWLFPLFGMTLTVIIIGLVNAVVSIASLRYIEKRIFRSFLNILLISVYLLAFVYRQEINDYLVSTYFTTKANKNMSYIQVEIPFSKNLPIQTKILDYTQTQYQTITKYANESISPKDTCFAIDGHNNFCDSWGESYHNALAIVPIGLMPRTENARGLVIGGGTLIPMRNLLSAGMEVDQVDIDKVFVEKVKSDPWLSKYHQNAYLSPKAKLYYEDAFYYLRNNEKKYDLIVMSLPGYGHDKLIHLASVEFFSFIKKSLSEEGIFVTWEYNNSIKNGPIAVTTNKHRSVIAKSMIDAGFDSYLPYTAWSESIESGKKQYRPGDEYWILEKKEGRTELDLSRNSYLSFFKEHNGPLVWKKLSSMVMTNERPNSVFAPNYDILTTY